MIGSLFYSLVWLFGFCLGLIAVLPKLLLDAVAGVVWLYELLSYEWFLAHEFLHKRACTLAGVDIGTEDFIADGGSQSYTAYSIRPSGTPTPAQAAVVGLAPILLVIPAILSFALAQVFYSSSSWVLLVLVIPFCLAGRYAYPSDSDAGFILRSSLSQPLSPVNFVALPVSLVFHVLNLPRHLHYRLSYVSDLAWMSLIYLSSAPLSRVLAPHLSPHLPLDLLSFL